MSKLTLDDAIKHCLEEAEKNEVKAQKIGVQFLGTTKDREATECRECAADHRQLAEWLTDYKELEAKHWDECRQIAHYDNDMTLLKQIIGDRLAYVEDYGKKILDGTYSDSYPENEGYCKALVDVLDIIEEVIYHG